MQDKIALILGNGPSLQKINFDEILKNNQVVTFATNRINLVFGKTDWRPDYYVCFTSLSKTDSNWKNSIREVVNSKKTKCYLLPECKAWLGDKENVEYVKVFEHPRNGPIPSDLFSIRTDDIFLKSFSATVPLFQLALSLEFKHLCIAGQDGYDSRRENNHFSKKYGYDPGNFEKSNKRLINLHLVLKNHCENGLIKIENISDISILEMHDKSNRFHNQEPENE